MIYNVLSNRVLKKRFEGEVHIMRMVRDITEVIVYVTVMGSVGCAVVIGMMNCMF